MLNPEIYSLNLSNFTHFYHHAFQVGGSGISPCIASGRKMVLGSGNLVDIATSQCFCAKKTAKFTQTPPFLLEKECKHVEKKAGKKYHFFHILCGSVTLEMFFWERSWHTLLNILIKFGQVNQVQPGSWTVLPKGWNSDTSKMWDLFECNFGIFFWVF